MSDNVTEGVDTNVKENVDTYVKEVAISIHLWRTGPMLTKHKVISIGLYFVITNGGKSSHFNKRYNIKIEQPKFDRNGKCIDYGDFDKNVWEDFYNKLSEKDYNMLTMDPAPKSEKYVWTDVGDTISNIYNNFPPREFDYIFLCTDSVTISTIDYHIEKTNFYQTIRYVNKKMIPTISIYDLLYMLTNEQKIMLAEKIKIYRERSETLFVENDRDPLNIATNNLCKFRLIQKIL